MPSYINAQWRKQGIKEIEVCKKCPKVNPYSDAIFDQSVTVRNGPGNGKEQTLHNCASMELRKSRYFVILSICYFEYLLF